MEKQLTRALGKSTENFKEETLSGDSYSTASNTDATCILHVREMESRHQSTQKRDRDHGEMEAAQRKLFDTSV